MEENGYRKYGIEQYFDFETLSILKETGSSLEEIRHIRDALDEEGQMELLKEKKTLLSLERKRLETQETMLENIINDLEDERKMKHDELTLAMR